MVPYEIVHKEIELCLTGKHWKEATEEGVNNRINNIRKNIKLTRSDLTINNLTEN